MVFDRVFLSASKPRRSECVPKRLDRVVPVTAFARLALLQNVPPRLPNRLRFRNPVSQCLTELREPITGHRGVLVVLQVALHSPIQETRPSWKLYRPRGLAQVIGVQLHSGVLGIQRRKQNPAKAERRECHQEHEFPYTAGGERRRQRRLAGAYPRVSLKGLQKARQVAQAGPYP